MYEVHRHEYLVGGTDMKKIRVALWGFGAMGSGVARMILKKQGIEIAAVIDRWDQLIGRDIFEVLDLPHGEHPPVLIKGSEDEALSPGSCDLVILATDSFTAKAYPKIAYCLERGFDVISTAEEMAWPKIQSPDLAEKMDRLALHHGKTVLGTGINPGFVLDLLILALTGTCETVDAIQASRINDLSPFGPAVMEEQGVGLSLDEFNRRVADDDLAGHVGFPESIAIIAEGLGLPIDEIEQSKEAIISRTERKTPYAQVYPGQVAGIRQQSYGRLADGTEFIHLDHPQQVLPELEGVETGDYITITSGDVSLQMAIKPEIPGGLGTIAMVVNMIPHVLNSSPGLKSLLDLPIPRAILGDMRLCLDKNKQKPRHYPTGAQVLIERVSLEAGHRAEGVPADTAEEALLIRQKGRLLHAAKSGEQVRIRTVTGREVQGRLLAEDSAYSHDFGAVVPELLAVHEQVKECLAEEV